MPPRITVLALDSHPSSYSYSRLHVPLGSPETQHELHLDVTLYPNDPESDSEDNTDDDSSDDSDEESDDATSEPRSPIASQDERDEEAPTPEVHPPIPPSSSGLESDSMSVDSAGSSEPPEVDTAEFCARVRAAVALGPIDAVVLHGMPNARMKDVWEALSGAQPWHLEMEEGYEEKEGEDEEAAIGRMKPSYPACYNSIEALVLNSPDCNSLFFYPEGRAQNLRSLTILNNFAIKTFVHTIACNPNLTHTLQNLTIVRPWTTHRSDIERTRNFIRGSKALKKLELVFTGSPADGDDWTEEELYANLEPVTLYLGLHAYLPPTLEYLALRIPTTRVSRIDIQKWLERARDGAWLPNLKEMGLSLNILA
ncbi:hypothetical protein NMY22_g743 [Coprinellus aureogranulatus]|nr:hypothetical protein NMY22_g743 [Coprinellus aureogranulatus]